MCVCKFRLYKGRHPGIVREKNRNYAGFLSAIMREKREIMRKIMRDDVIAKTLK